LVFPSLCEATRHLSPSFFVFRFFRLRPPPNTPLVNPQPETHLAFMTVRRALFSPRCSFAPSEFRLSKPPNPSPPPQCYSRAPDFPIPFLSPLFSPPNPEALSSPLLEITSHQNSPNAFPLQLIVSRIKAHPLPFPRTPSLPPSPPGWIGVHSLF